MNNKLPLTAEEFNGFNDIAARLPDDTLPKDLESSFTSAVFFVVAAEASTWTPELVRRVRAYNFGREEYLSGVEALLQKLLMSVRRDIIAGLKRERAALDRAYEGRECGDVLSELVIPSINHDIALLKDVLHEAEYHLRRTTTWNIESRRNARLRRAVLIDEENSS